MRCCSFSIYSACAVFSNDSLTMTFYYDTLKDVRAAKGLKAYELDLDFSNTLAPLWHEDTLFQTITKAVYIPASLYYGYEAGTNLFGNQ